MGQSYLLGCPEGGEKALTAAVAAVDKEMCSIRDAGKVKARERIAVLSALNLAFELAKRDLPSATPPAQTTSALPADQAHIQALIQKLDRALGNDGRLL